MAATMNGLDAISGTNGKLMHDGQYLINVKEFEAKVEIEKQEFNVIGDMWKKYKTTGLTGSGQMTLMKMDYAFVKKIAAVAKGGAPFVTELVAQLDDPQNPHAKDKVRLKNVQFDAIPLAKYAVNELVEEELQFTFEGFDITS